MNLRTSRRAAGLLATLTLTFGLAACGTGGPIESEDYTRDREGTVETSAAAPSTFMNKAAWKANRKDGAPLIITSFGLLTFSPDTGKDTYSAVMLDPATGKVQWATRAVSSPEGMPALAWTEQDDRPWVTITASQGNKTSIYTYDPMVGSMRVAATTSVAFEGNDKAPEVVTSDNGVLVLGAKEAAAMQYRPQQRATTVYGKGPERNGGPGTPIIVHDDGFLLTFPESGFAFASDNGGWDSARIAPDGVDRAKGDIRAMKDGFLLVQWPSLTGGDGNQTLWLHSLQTGRPIAEFDATDSLIEAQVKDKDGLVVSTDKRIVAWGEVIFDLDANEGKEVDLHDGSPYYIHNDILYVEGATEPFPLEHAPVEQAPATATPSSDASATTGDAPAKSASPATSSGNPSTTAEPSASTASPEGTSSTSAPEEDVPFHGYAALRLETEQALPGEVGMLPMGFTSLGHGIFVTGNNEVYAIALR